MDGTFLKRVVSLLCVAACNLDAAFDRATEYHAGAVDQASGTSSTTSTGVPTTGPADSGGVFTTTGDLPETSGVELTGAVDTNDTTSAEATPPRIVAFTVKPNPVKAVGPVIIALDATGDVEQLELEVDGQVLATGPGPSLKAPYEALSSTGNGGHTVVARVAGAGMVVEDSIELQQAVPVGGTPVWTSAIVPDGLTTMGSRVALYGDYTFVVGTEMGGGGPRILVRCYSGGSLTWSASIHDWTELEAAEKEDSNGLDIEVNAAGVVVAGNIFIGGQPRRYHARLTHAGELANEWLGNPGEFAGGLALGAAGEIVLVGGVFEKFNRTDVAWWSYGPTDVPVAAPVWPGAAGSNDVGVAVAVEANTGDVYLAGQTQVPDSDDILTMVGRQLLLKYTIQGLLLETSVSSGEFGPDEAASVVATPDGPCTTGSTGSGVDRHAVTRCFTADLQPRWARREQAPGAGFDIDRNRAGLIIIAGVHTATNVPQARVQAIRQDDPLGPPLWFYEFLNPDNQVDEARGVRCDPWGRCRWTGWQTAGGSYLVVGELTP